MEVWPSWPKVASIVLGLWLVVSAIVWSHDTMQANEFWVVGVFVIVVAALSMMLPAMRYVNLVSAVWLFLYALWVPHVMRATFWNGVITAALLLVLSIVPGGPARPRRLFGRGHHDEPHPRGA